MLPCRNDEGEQLGRGGYSLCVDAKALDSSAIRRALVLDCTLQGSHSLAVNQTLYKHAWFDSKAIHGGSIRRVTIPIKNARLACKPSAVVETALRAHECSRSNPFANCPRQMDVFRLEGRRTGSTLHQQTGHMSRKPVVQS